MKKKLLILLISLFPLAGHCPEMNKPAKDQQIKQAKKHIFIRDVYSMEFSVENFRQALEYAEIKEPEIVFRQAVLETGNFTSELFRCANNLFGMRLARYRTTTALSEYNYHAKYNSWWDSVLDYKLWQDYYLNNGWNMEDYFGFLWGVQYATDDHYITKLQNLDLTVI